MTDYSGVNDAYGKNGTITNSQKFRNSQYMLDDNTRKQLEYIVSGKAEFDDSLITDAKKELDYWNSIVPITGGGYSSNAQFAYNAQLKAIEEQRKYQEQLAEQARQDAIKNAYTTYDRSLPTFGQNAERLAQMGLTNSGYSDYLGGVAYSSMVGGIQDAHKTANDAIRDAYYNAELQKAQAADTLYNRQVAEQNENYNRQLQERQLKAAEKSAYDSALSTVLVNVGKGMNLETALAYAQANGITDEADLQMIEKAANAYKTENEIIKKQERADTFANILAAASYGDYTAEEIQALASMHGFSPEETEVLLEAVYRYLAYMMNENVKTTTTYNGSGGSTTTYQITDEYGNTKTVSSVKGH